MRRGVDWFAGVAMATAMLASAGCRSTAPVGGRHLAASPGYRYSAGTASRGFERGRPEVEVAATEALRDLNINRVGFVRQDAGELRVRGRADDGRRVDLTLVEHGPRTEARVRVGLFGDEPMARALLDRIGVRLGSRAPEPIPGEVASEPGGNPYFSRDGVSDAEMYRDIADPGYQQGPIP